MKTLSALVLALSGAVVAVASPAPEATSCPGVDATLMQADADRGVAGLGGCAPASEPGAAPIGH